jgi:hypothetical protein
MRKLGPKGRFHSRSRALEHSLTLLGHGDPTRALAGEP